MIDLASVTLRDAGVGCFRSTVGRQDNDIQSGLFLHLSHLNGRPQDERRREMLSVYCTRVAEARTGAEVWLAKGPEREEQVPDSTRTADMLCWLRAEQANMTEYMPHAATGGSGSPRSLDPVRTGNHRRASGQKVLFTRARSAAGLGL